MSLMNVNVSAPEENTAPCQKPLLRGAELAALAEKYGLKQ